MYTLPTILKLGGVQSVAFCACLNQFLSKVFFLWQVQGSVIYGLNVQIQDHLGMAAWVPAIVGGVDWDPFHKLGGRVFQQSQGVVLHSSWLICG